MRFYRKEMLMSAGDCENGANGFVDIPDDLEGTVAKSVDLGDGVIVTLEYGTVAGHQRAWARISGSTTRGDGVWMYWTTDSGWSNRVVCGPFLVDAAGQSKTSAAKTTNRSPKWQFNACGNHPHDDMQICTGWW